jgi:hypothetical protein
MTQQLRSRSCIAGGIGAARASGPTPSVDAVTVVRVAGLLHRRVEARHAQERPRARSRQRRFTDHRLVVLGGGGLGASVDLSDGVTITGTNSD